MAGSLTIHHTPETNPDTSVPDMHQDYFSKRYLGFWVYLMTDCLVFASLFITWAVLRNNTFGGPSSKELFDLKSAFAETMALLSSSVTCGLAVLSAKESRKNRALFWLVATFIFGVTFLVLELNEFIHFVQMGHSWDKSGFLSSFFGLVGAHGLHISFGLLWVSVMVGQISVLGITVDTFRRLVLFSLFWHFLDLVWIFIFTFVYLMGVL